MSKWNRPMRPFKLDTIICPRCQKPIRITEATEFRYGAYQHATNCVAPPTREAYMARVAVKRTARKESHG